MDEIKENIINENNKLISNSNSCSTCFYFLNGECDGSTEPCLFPIINDTEPIFTPEEINNLTAPDPPENYLNVLEKETLKEINTQNSGVKKNKKNLLFKIFVTLCVISILISLIIGINNIIIDKNKFKPKDNTSITLTDSPNTDIEYKEFKGEKLSAAQIANKCKHSNVAIMTYSENSVVGQGSGIVMSLDDTGKNTYIITCAHVIDTTGTKLTIETADGETYDATVVGKDARTDIGVIKANTNKLTCAEFGNSDKLVVGDNIYAIGNPGGTEFFGSFTSGHVSAINRPVDSESGYSSKCIQHDAAINPGNSGGMLVNEYGQVIGINSQKIASTAYEGMGFAIPVSVAKPIIDNLIQNGYVANRAKLGIKYYPLSASYSYSMFAQIKGLPAGSIIIGDTFENNAFAEKGIQQYDIITSINNKNLDNTDILASVIENSKPGDIVKLNIVRIKENYEAEELTVSVPLIEDTGTYPVSENTTPAINPFSNSLF